jgi:hypothetical protein
MWFMQGLLCVIRMTPYHDGATRTGGYTMRNAFAGLLAAAALLFAASPAHADVPRYQLTKGTLIVSLTEPNVGWVHTFEITVSPCDRSFNGTGVNRSNGVYSNDETITGYIGEDGVVTEWHATYTSGPYEGYNWGWSGGADLVTSDDWGRALGFTMNSVDLAPGALQFSTHGAYVKYMGGGDDAAHSCIGKPVVSKP